MEYKVSVVIPAYNASKHINRSIGSALKQYYPVYEIIVIDDGSKDDTAEIVRKISSPQIKYIHQNNSGPSKARNTGILKSSGDFIAFLDADDEWYVDHILDAITFFKDKPDICWFTSAFDIRNPYGKIIPKLLDTDDTTVDYFEQSLRNTFVHTSSLVVKRSVFDNVGLFNECWKFGEDLNMWFRIALQYPKIGYDKKCGSVFKKTEGSLTYDKTNFNLRNTIKVIYFTNKEIESSKNKSARLLVNQWIEDAVFSAIIMKNDFILKYIKKRWKHRMGTYTLFMLICYKLLPLNLVRAFNFINKKKRKHSLHFS